MRAPFRPLLNYSLALIRRDFDRARRKRLSPSDTVGWTPAGGGRLRKQRQDEEPDINHMAHYIRN